MLFIGSLGSGEIIVLLIVIVIVVGPGKLPETARMVGKWWRNFKRTADDIKAKFEDELYPDDEDDDNFDDFYEKTSFLDEQNNSNSAQESKTEELKTGEPKTEESKTKKRHVTKE